MGSIVQHLEKRELIRPPSFLSSNTHYEVMMGSVAYGVSSDTSDMDIYGWCIPPKEVIFPHLAGEIMGFGRQKKKFQQYQQHHIFCKSDDAGKGKEYDVTIYNIVKYFSLCMENNPNMIDSLFVPRFCILHSTQIGEMVREKRKMFLHKGSWHKFKGYAYSQLHKMRTKAPEEGSKRAELRDKFGFDVKFAYHVVRLLDEVEQILNYGDIDLQRAREHLKEIRRGEVPEAEIRRWATEKEKYLEKLYEDSSLRHSPDEVAVKQLLIDCLEHHYGSLEKAVSTPDSAAHLVLEMECTIRELEETLVKLKRAMI